MDQVLFKSNSDEWTTPQDVFDELNAEFHFNLDCCAAENNHKCPQYFTKEQNGLEQSWAGHRAFCNPPYSQIKKWVKKAWQETRSENTVVVLLIPARTDTKYFHDYIYHRAEVRFIKSRLKFSGSRNNAPFPSMVVIFRGAKVEC